MMVNSVVAESVTIPPRLVWRLNSGESSYNEHRRRECRLYRGRTR
jgi:hypothetical protein